MSRRYISPCLIIVWLFSKFFYRLVVVGQGKIEFGNPSIEISNKATVTQPKSETPQFVLPCPQAIQVLRDLQEWKLVPDSLYQDTSKKPLESLIYGPIHLLRLFVKLPEIIGLMSTMPVKKKKLVLKYMDSVLEYLQSHQDFFQ